MGQKHLVCNGAVCQCKFGTTPDKLKVKQTDFYINENAPGQKAIANTMDIGQPFAANTFGACKITKSACKPAITQWQGVHDKLTMENGGHPLLEDSKAVCAVGGSPCVEISFHGQTANVHPSSGQKTNDNTQKILNPFFSFMGLEEIGYTRLPQKQSANGN
ncbi:DUF4280 domain-containing protein [Niabella sp.]|uniref:DUF4280 domain-containing protein n=1 Tax=Niabella sp. TaxID=1962976 RepID=UPI00262CD42C|nr:DUF4280 domain-containing protein [Niabella sp.]